MTNIDDGGLVFGSLFFGEASDKDEGIDIDVDAILNPEPKKKKTVKAPRAYRSRPLFGRNRDFDRETLADGSIFSQQREDLSLQDVINT